jgi:dihydrofolate reductase
MTTHKQNAHKITLIAAMGTDRTIGLHNGMPWHLPEDLKHFKARTLGKTMIMGRNTFESIGKPLPGRKTIIVSRTQTTDFYNHPDCQVAASFEQALAFAREATSNGGEIMVVGGGQIYRLALPFATHLAITQIKKAFNGDTFFPQWNGEEWSLESETNHQQVNEPFLEYSFLEFARQA